MRPFVSQLVLLTSMAPVPPGMVSWSAVSHSSLPFWSMSANLPWLPSARSACPACHAAVGRVAAARVRVGDAVVGDEAGAVAFAEAERVRVPGAHLAVGGEAEVQEERGGFEALPVVHDERERLHVVFVAVAVEALAVVPCDARPVGVGVAHPGELGEAWHGVRLAGDDDAHQIRLLPAVVAFVSLMACVAATRLMARMSL